MQKNILFIMLLCFSAIANAQKIRVSGTVVDQNGNAISDVSVRELDENRRVINYTKTDENGIFSFKVQDNYNSIQFLATGYRKLTHKMLGHHKVTATMEERRMSPYAKNARLLMRSEELLCGRYMGQSFPVSVWVEQLNDTLFTLIVPVETDTEIDEYPTGRQLIILTPMGQPEQQWTNVVDVYPVYGSWEEVDGMRLTQTYDGIGKTTGLSEKGNFFVYPHFQFSLSQLEKLLKNPDVIARIAVDTYKADNYWNFYPTMQTEHELRRILEKSAKTNK